MDEVEKLASELYWKCSQYSWDGQQNSMVLDSKEVVRFVMRREIEARMNEHDKICGVCKDLKTPCFRLAELRKQLTKIGE